jgi:hypothetical protein
VFVQGYHPNVVSVNTSFPANPTLRHNFFKGPPLTKYIRHKTGDLNGEKVNAHEKLTYVIKRLLEYVLMPGDHVLIVGTGAGGDVRGCIEAGWHVTGIEQDIEQLENLCGQVTVYDTLAEVTECSPAKRGSALDITMEAGAEDDPVCKTCKKTVQDADLLVCSKCGTRNCPVCTPEKDDVLVCTSCDNDPAPDAANSKESAEKPEDTADTGGNEQVQMKINIFNFREHGFGLSE